MHARGSFAEKVRGEATVQGEARMTTDVRMIQLLMELRRQGIGDTDILSALETTPREMFVQTSGASDGLTIDTGGNLFVATTTGIEVLHRDGARWGVIAVPEQPANCAFGDADHRTLYITARTSVYRVRLAHAGLI